MSNQLRENIANERRRLRSVRQALTQAVEDAAAKSDEYPPFYVAIGNYMEAAMERLHAQDIKMGDMIREKSENLDPERVAQALAELDERLTGNQDYLTKFLAARDELSRQGKAAVERFEQTARDYTRYIVANMGHHGATTDLAQELFSPDDWTFMAGVTEDDMEREQRLHDAVRESLPAGANLDG